MALKFKAKTSSTGVRWLSDEAFARGLPFAVVAALTLTAKECRVAALAEAERSMTIRNDYTRRGISFMSASKATPVATVWGSPVSSHDNVPYLSLQAVGGRKVPQPGHSMLAVPTRDLRGAFSSAIPAAKLLSQMSQKSKTRAVKAQEGIYQGQYKKAPFWLTYSRGGQQVRALAQHNEYEKLKRAADKWKRAHDKELLRAAYAGKGKTRQARAELARMRLAVMGDWKPQRLARNRRLKFLWTMPTSAEIAHRYEFFAVVQSLALRRFPEQLRESMLKYAPR